MAKFSSLLISVAMTSVAARAETTDELYSQAAKAMEVIRGMKNAASVATLPAPILVQPMPGDVVAQKRFEALSQASNGDKVASAMILQRLRLEELFKEYKMQSDAQLKETGGRRGDLSEKTFADMERLRNLSWELFNVSKDQLLQLPLTSADKAKNCQRKSGKDWEDLGKVLASRGPIGDQGWKTAESSARFMSALGDCKDEAWVRAWEVKKIWDIATRVETKFQELDGIIKNQRQGQKLAEINEDRIRHQYDGAPGVEDLEKPVHAESAPQP